MKEIQFKDVMTGDEISFIASPNNNQTNKVSYIDRKNNGMVFLMFEGDTKTYKYWNDAKCTLVVRPLPNWKAEPAKLVGEPVITDYEVKIVFDDGTKTALYFKELDFIKDLGMVNVDRIIITPRWRNK